MLVLVIYDNPYVITNLENATAANASSINLSVPDGVNVVEDNTPNDKNMEVYIYRSTTQTRYARPFFIFINDNGEVDVFYGDFIAI